MSRPRRRVKRQSQKIKKKVIEPILPRAKKEGKEKQKQEREKLETKPFHVRITFEIRNLAPLLRIPRGVSRGAGVGQF